MVPAPSALLCGPVGTSIIATDDHSWEKNYPDWFQAPWTEIEKLDCLQAIEKYGRANGPPAVLLAVQRRLLLSGAPEDAGSHPSMKMIYIGEPAGQATASDQFFDAMEEVDDDSFYAAVASFLPHTRSTTPYAHQMTGRRPANAGRIFVHPFNRVPHSPEATALVANTPAILSVGSCSLFPAR